MVEASGGPISRAATGPRTRRFVLASRASSPSWCSTRVSRAARAETFTGDGFSIDLYAGPLPRLHPGRLHRGRQHPGGVSSKANVERRCSSRRRGEASSSSPPLGSSHARDPDCWRLASPHYPGRPDNRGDVDMRERVHESRRRGIARRVGAAGMALATLLGLAGCHEAYGGGYIGEPLDGRPDRRLQRAMQASASASQCDAGVKGQITGLDTSTKGAFPGSGSTALWTSPDRGRPGRSATPEVDQTVVQPAATCEEVVEASRRPMFEGTYRSQDKAAAVSKPPGRFIVLVFDQGEPGRPRGDFTGDGFAIELTGWCLQRLRPGRLYRGRQHPGGVTSRPHQAAARRSATALTPRHSPGCSQPLLLVLITYAGAWF